MAYFELARSVHLIYCFHVYIINIIKYIMLNLVKNIMSMCLNVLTYCLHQSLVNRITVFMILKPLILFCQNLIYKTMFHSIQKQYCIRAAMIYCQSFALPRNLDVYMPDVLVSKRCHR